MKDTQLRSLPGSRETQSGSLYWMAAILIVFWPAGVSAQPGQGATSRPENVNAFTAENPMRGHPRAVQANREAPVIENRVQTGSQQEEQLRLDQAREKGLKLAEAHGKAKQKQLKKAALLLGAGVAAVPPIFFTGGATALITGTAAVGSIQAARAAYQHHTKQKKLLQEHRLPTRVSHNPLRPGTSPSP